jgi:hypothetical protein
MKNKNEILIYFFFLCVGMITSKLEKTFTLFRHSARNELKLEKLVKEELSKYNKGELTGLGLAMAIEKGKLYKEYYSENYPEFIENTKLQDIEIISTAVERTIYTAISFLKGYTSDVGATTIHLKSFSDNDDNAIVNAVNSSMNPYREMFLKSHQPVDMTINVLKKEDRMFSKMKCIVDSKENESTLLEGIRLNVAQDWGVIERITEQFPDIYKTYCEYAELDSDCLLNHNDDETRREFIIVLAGFIEIIEFYDIAIVDPMIRNLADKYYILSKYNYTPQHTIDQGTINFRLLRTFFADNRCNASLSLNKDAQENSIREVLNKIRCKKQVMLFSHDDVFAHTIANLIDYKEDMSTLLRNNETYETNKNRFQLYWAPLLSELIFELHDIDGSKYIKIRFNEEELKLLPFYPYANGKSLQYSENGISFKDFIQYLSDRININTKYKDC